MIEEERISKTGKSAGTTVPGAFVGETGCLCARVHRLQSTPAGEIYHGQTAVYPSIGAYNTRSSRPEYKQLSGVIADYKEPVMIDLETLTIDPKEIS